MNKYEIEDLIFCVYDIDQREDLSEPYVKFELMFEDCSGKHTIEYNFLFEEARSAVIHQLKKILKYPQNYIDVNVFITTSEPPEHYRTYVLGKNKKKLSEFFSNDYKSNFFVEK